MSKRLTTFSKLIITLATVATIVFVGNALILSMSSDGTFIEPGDCVVYKNKIYVVQKAPSFSNDRTEYEIYHIKTQVELKVEGWKLAKINCNEQ